MPLYEYRCSKCDKTFEVMRKFSDPPLTVHEDCGGTIEQLISAPAFQLKGTGWYVTDYAKAGAKTDSGSDGKTSDSKDSESKKSESKDSGSKDGEAKANDKKPAEKKTETKTESKPAATPAKTDK